MKLVVTFNLTTKFGGDENGLLQFPHSAACVAIIDLEIIIRNLVFNFFIVYKVGAL